MLRNWFLRFGFLALLLAFPASTPVVFAQLEQENDQQALFCGHVSPNEAKGSPALATDVVKGPRPQLTWLGFGHFQYEAENFKDDQSEDTNNFANGDMDLFIHSDITEKVAFKAETLFEFGAEGENTIDVERIFISYQASDWLQLSVGRHHTSLGYWNQRFHHGAWFQPSATRPVMYRFEDEGGVLPAHFVGVEAFGALDTGAGIFSYTAMLGNGRGKIPDSVQLTGDQNKGKAFGLQLIFKPSFIPGFGIGVNGYWDKIPTDPETPGRDQEIKEGITGLHAFYGNDWFDLIGDVQKINHKDSEWADAKKDHTGAFGMFLLHFGKFHPYYRYDKLDIEEGDTFFGTVAEIEDIKQNVLGFRYDALDYLCYKLEIRSGDNDSGKTTGGTAQVAFGF